MAKVTPNFDFLEISAEKRSLTKFVRMLQKKWQELAFLFNGHVGFGDGANADNIDGVWVSMNTGAGNVNVTLTHNLGRLPVGYIPMTKSAASDVYNGTTASTSTQITLKGSVGGVTVLLFIF